MKEGSSPWREEADWAGAPAPRGVLQTQYRRLLGAGLRSLFVLALVVMCAAAFTPASAAAQTSKCAARPPLVGTVTSEINDEKVPGPAINSLKIVANVTWKCDEARGVYTPTGTWTLEFRQKTIPAPNRSGGFTQTSSASGSIAPGDGYLAINWSESPPSYEGVGSLRAKVESTALFDNGFAWTRSEAQAIPWWGGRLLDVAKFKEGLALGRKVEWTVKPDGSIDDSASVSYERGGTMKVHWHFDGELPGLELLVVDPQSYETWRPEAGLNERTIGNEIKIDAKLEGPDGGVAKVKARKIIFELTGTSREPGVALNFPLAAGTSGDFDLQFSPKSNPPGGYIITGPGNQRAETVPGQYTSASVMVSSFDWGAWSTLKVTAELEDGRSVTGHLRGKSGPTEILLPKRAKDSQIADIWKENAGVSLPDADDSERGPAGESSPGDGFSLYEEYRGFYVHGEHIAGDPKTIDFFVRNYIGPDAEPGIFFFADLTGTEVHSRLLDTEFDRKKRVMNANHGQGPHLVDQHGVFLETRAGLDGGLTIFSKAGVRGRPSITLSVNLQPRDSLTGMTTSENVPFSDLASAYDRAVAHELMHSVGAEHHGEGDGTAVFYFHYGDDPQNATGKPYFSFDNLPAGSTYLGFARLPGVGDVKTIIDEASGRDLASLMEGDMMLARESMRPFRYPGMLEAARKYLAARQGYNIPWTAEQLAEHDFDSSITSVGNWWYVGAEHGECSGDELCVMRYSFARLYEKRGTKNAFYHITKSRTERAGLELCRSPVGTGVNDKNRKPQPRYGDAAATRGACAASIIFNDALPLKSDAIPKEVKP